MRRFAFLAAFALLFFQPADAQQAAPDAELMRFAMEAIQGTASIKPGMTRKDLLRLYAGSGGPSHPTRRTYGYRKCPYIQVDVEFEPAGMQRDAEGRIRHESDGDVISRISRPYLALLTTD